MKPPRSTPLKVLGWSALVLSGAFVAFFAIVGILSVTRGTPTRVVHAFGEPGGALAPADPAFVTTVELLTSTPLEPGHRIDLLLDGDGTFPTLWRDLRAATTSITVQIYFAEPGALADTLFAVLAERARAGVRVHFLYDGFGASFDDERTDALRDAGVRVAVFRPVKWYSPDRAARRSHVRAVVIDGATGYTGGFGIADVWLGDGRTDGQWRETNVRFTGPAVGQLQALFAAGWTEATGELLVGELFFPLASETGTAAGTATGTATGTAAEAEGGTATAGLVHARPSGGSTVAERLMVLSFAGARRSLYVANSYFVPNDILLRLLAQAVARGVDVRLLLPGEKTDIPTTRQAGRARYETLLGAGVRIWEYEPTMMHAKTFVVDGVWSAVGSMNLDNRSLAHNDESILVVHDAALGARMDSLFLADLEHAREIRLQTFRERPWWHRLRERGASLVGGVL